MQEALEGLFNYTHVVRIGLAHFELPASSGTSHVTVAVVADRGLPDVSPLTWVAETSGLRRTQTPVVAWINSRLVITEEQVDAYVVHWGGFLLDLTVGFFMVASAVRPFGVLFCVLFNAMNSRMFAIGMFPYVMIVLTTIFFGYSWPKKLAAILPQYMRNMVPDLSPSRPDFLNCWYPGRRKVSIHSTGSRKVELRLRRWKMTAFLVCLHVLLQLFLPYSHGITKGYNTWTQGSYGYSWDMMVHNWRPVHVKLVLYDNATHRAHFVDPEARHAIAQPRVPAL
ncbi:hypothetical protein HPB51_003082 [Rhipicephalus microplus]|uniref:Uncharacterized protein n=1 Tax=Rhipicephalus microplus TaxID=6941 RepID=A0A9J6EFE3_RHIMP|nr:hypothetical protein HPB51_003082 [Rhipicephalus microplus]